MKQIELGIVVNSNATPAWAARTIDHLITESLARIAFVVDVKAERPPARRSKPGIIRRGLSRFESFLIGSPAIGRNPFEPKVLRRLDAPSFEAYERSGELHVPGDIWPDLAARECDVVISFVDEILPYLLFEIARTGVWDIVVGSSRTNLSTTGGHDEVLTSDPVTRSFLRQRSAPDDIGVSLYTSASCTESMSVAANSMLNFWKASFYIPRVLKEIRQGSMAIAPQELPNKNASRAAPDLSVREVSGFRHALLLGSKFFQKLKRKWRDVFYDQQWILGIRYADEVPRDFSDFELLVPPDDRFWADPFLFEWQNRSYLFFEELPYDTNRGEIVAVELDETGFVGEPATVLAKDYHLSYPFVFEFDGEIFMIPESFDNGTVDLFQCTDFPNKWVLEKNLFAGQRFVDVTIHEHGGTYWLFANACEIDEISPWDEMYLFYSESPTSAEWTPHPENPVVSDVRTSRPAGRVFAHDDKLIRPSQNCAPHYGYGLNFCEIVELTKTRYREAVLKRFEPDWDPSICSLHTFNRSGRIQVVDFQRWNRKSLVKRR